MYSSNLYFISFNSSFCSWVPMSNIDTWPARPFFFSLWILSIIFSNDANSVLLVCSNSSNVPAFIKLSTHFLFTASSAILSQKSVNPLYCPFFSLSSTIFWTGTVPTFFILPKPNLIANWAFLFKSFSSFWFFSLLSKFFKFSSIFSTVNLL